MVEPARGVLNGGGPSGPELPKPATDNSPPEKRYIDDVNDAITSDCKRVCNPDIHRPFSSLKDIVERLLPYHLVASEDVDHANQRDVKDLEAKTMVSRQDAWIGYSTKKSIELEKQRAKLSNRIEAYESTELEKSEILRIAMCAFTEAETKRELDIESKKAAIEKEKVVAAEKKAALASLEKPPLTVGQESNQQIESSKAQAMQGAETIKEAPVVLSAEGNTAMEPGPPVSTQATTIPPQQVQPKVGSLPPQPKKEDVRAKLLAAGLKLKLNKR